MRSSMLARGAACQRLSLAGLHNCLGWSQARGHAQPQQARSLTAARARAEASSGPGSPKVVILGGGFGGLYTAVRLCSLFWPRGKQPQVTLVDQHDRFVFKPLLYELLSGTASETEVAPTYEQLLAPYPIRFLQAKAVAAQPEQQLRDGGSSGGGVVQLEGGQQLEYDWLVVALGAQVDARGVPGVLENAIPFNTLQDALKVRDALSSIEQAAAISAEPRSVMVVGAGYAGVELACVVAERLRNQGLAGRVQVHLVTPGASVLEGSPAGQREAAEQVLASFGIHVTTGTRVTSIEKPAAGLVWSGQEDQLPTSVLVNLDDIPPASEQVRSAAANVADATAAAAASVADAASYAATSLRDPSAASTTVQDAASTSQSTYSNNGLGSAGQQPAEEASLSSSPSYSTQQQEFQQHQGAQQVSSDLVMWTAGSSPVTKSARKGFPFPTNNKGSVKTDATLRVLSHSRVFALGDVCVANQGYVQDASSTSALGGQRSTATPPSATTASSSAPGASPGAAGNAPTSSFPATAQVAFQQADYVAWNVWAAIAGRPLLPFKYQHLGSMMSLGTFNAALELPISLPEQLTATLQASPVAPLLSTLGVKLTNTGSSGAAASSAGGGVTLEGPLAALIRRAAYLYRQPTTEQRLMVASEWASQAANIAQSAASLLQQQQQQRM